MALLTPIGASVLGTDYILGAFLGATVISLNFAALILLGKYFFTDPKRKAIPVLLLIAHIFITPGSLFFLIRYMDINTIAIIIGVLASATISPLAMAVIGLAHAGSLRRLSLAHERPGVEEEGR